MIIDKYTDMGSALLRKLDDEDLTTSHPDLEDALMKEYVKGHNAGSNKVRAQHAEALNASEEQKRTIKTLNEKVVELEDTIKDLNKPWYIKLINKLPIYKLSIKKVYPWSDYR